MSQQKPKGYDTTIARIAGNILSGQPNVWLQGDDTLEVQAKAAVKLARMIVAETKRTEPTPDETP